MPDTEPALKSGFTLIEMSMVLVVIGFIVGGILTGRDLMDAAAQRAQLAQIEKYQTAVHTFQYKYGGLPGDLQDPQATQFGFQSRGQYPGEGDGNGILAGNCNNSANADPVKTGCGEVAVFWQDLSIANLIDTSVPIGANQPNISAPVGGGCCATIPANPGLLTNWIPTAKLGLNNFIYVYSLNGINYFGLSEVQKIGWNIQSTHTAGVGLQTMTVQQAYNMDSKVDDGLPQSGSVTACHLDWNIACCSPVWVAGGSNQGAGGASCAPTTTATPYSNTNCFDNNGIAGTQTYSINQNASQPNCALSFKFQ